MRVRGTRFELSEAETRVMHDLATKELMRQIRKHQSSNITPANFDLLTSMLTKLTRALKKLNPDTPKIIINLKGE